MLLLTAARPLSKPAFQEMHMMALPRCTSTAAKVPLMVIRSPYSLSSQPVVGADRAHEGRACGENPLLGFTPGCCCDGRTASLRHRAAVFTGVGRRGCRRLDPLLFSRRAAACRWAQPSPQSAVTRFPQCISRCCCPKPASRRRTWTWRRSRPPRRPGRHAPAPPPCAPTAL